MATIRSSARVWLLGMPSEDIISAHLPSNGQVLMECMYHLQENRLTVKRSIRLAIDATLIYWQKARIPTQRVDNGERKLQKLYNEYCQLKKNRQTKLDSIRLKEELFKSKIAELFDIARADA